MATSEAHGAPFTPSGPAHNLGYEPDRFAVAPILAVPVAVLVTMVVAYVTTSLVFSSFFAPNDPEFREPSTFPIAEERGKQPLNERLTRVSTTDPKAEVVQPRLEALRTKVIVKRSDGFEITGETITQQPEHKPGVNSPEYHPEDLRADRWKELTSYATDKATGITRIPVDKAIALLLSGGNLPAQKDAKPAAKAEDLPKESNGGQPLTARLKTEEPKEVPKGDHPPKDKK